MKRAALLILALLISACSSLPHVIQPVAGDYAEVDDTIFVVSHGWHTGLVIPARLIQSRIPELKARFKDAPYIEIGWGDKGFYQSTEITSGLTIRAIFWPTESVMHVVAIPEKADQYFPHSRVEKICLTGYQYSTLIRFIESSFYKDEQGMIVRLKTGIYGDSQFYKSVGDYYLMNTCNKWTAKALKSCGMDIKPTFKLSAGSVMDYIVEHNQGSAQGNCSALSSAKE
ncbi:MAG: TIGR02117 family protein [Gammaproteobacteria bacterium]|nr:TIGR02117 family protein [Gammaproteobacteria bacterium]MBL6998482.1 TIGR02117 family protein [Gammaproteobacteria bacterium]